MDERTPLLNNHPQFSISTINHRRTRGENDFQTPVRPVSGKVNTAPQDDNNAEVINSETFNNIRRDVEGHHAVQPKNVHIEQGHILKVGFQSLDYEISDNQIYQNEEKEKSFKRWKLYWRGVKRWIICFLIGVFTGLTAGFIDFGVEKISEVKFQTVKIWVDKCVLDNCMYLPQILWFLINMGLVLVGSFLTTYFEPVSAGSGIPQIKCYLNGVIVPHVVRFKTLVIKVIGVLSAVAGGLAVGKEGPMIHSGAVIAAGISQGRTTSLGWDFKIFQEFRSDTEKRDFVSAGAAAGVAAAFGAPVGGVLFSLEEGASFWNQSLVWRIFFASIISTMTLNIVQGLIKGHPMDFSYPGLINFGTFDDVRYEFYELFIVICLGAIGGLLGALFNHINLKLTVFRMKYVQRKWQKVLETMMVAMYTAAFAYIIIFYKNDCKPIENDAETTLVQFFCQDGQYSSTARLFFDTPEATVKHLFHNVPGTYQVVTLTIFASGYFLLACWTYGLSIPSGLFIPSLLIGAAWGRIAGILLSGLPGLEVNTELVLWKCEIYPVSRDPLLVNNLYQHEKESHKEASICSFIAKHSLPLIIAPHLMVDGCQTFGTFKGLILRSHLITMLKKKLFLENPEINKIVNNLKMSEFNESYPRYTGIQRISISPEEKHYTMDLAPFINQSHFVVLETASYSSIFRKFRSLGLRHMVVINFRNQVIGIVTRKDLARFMTECKNGEISIQEIPIIH
uniref:Chloride channel protein n=1 Tax=Biomphalaria glabrata TaxID=6526 RepID=A0A2C9K7Z3_BIOGL